MQLQNGQSTVYARCKWNCKLLLHKWRMRLRRSGFGGLVEGLQRHLKECCFPFFFFNCWWNLKHIATEIWCEITFPWEKIHGSPRWFWIDSLRARVLHHPWIVMRWQPFLGTVFGDCVTCNISTFMLMPPKTCSARAPNPALFGLQEAATLQSTASEGCGCQEQPMDFWGNSCRVRNPHSCRASSSWST